MDGGFKRLWARKRNKGNTSVKRSTPVDDNAIFHSRPSMSTTDGRPSITLSSNMLDRPSSQDRLGSSRGYASVSSDDYNHPPKSGHRIQPILVGISRPAYFSDRPSTAGSMQYAVQHAADLDGRKSSELLGSQTIPATYHKRVHSPRYVDIFAVAGSVPAHKSPFNEEIAERNLDVLRVAMDEEQSDYIPSSKYQEEVANRNASPLYGTRTSEDHGLRLTDLNRYISSPSRTERQTNILQPNGYHTRQASGEYNSSDNTSPEAVGRHTQPYSPQRNNAGVEALPAPYEESFEAGQRLIEPNHDLVAGKPRLYGKPARDGHSQPQPAMHTITENSVPRQHSSSDENSEAYRGNGTGNSSSRDGYIEYTLSASELGGRAQPRQPLLRSTDTSPSSERRHMESYMRAPSATSTRSYKKTINLQNRTIMDLTGEDDGVSETSSICGSENAPVIEQAKWHSIQRVVPNQPDTYSRIISNETTPIPTPEESGRSSGLHHIQPVQRLPPPDKRPVHQPLKIAFSPINTLASVTPRASVIVQKEQPMSMVQRATAALEARNASSALQTPQTSSSTANQNLTRGEPYSDGTRSGEVTPKAEALNSSSAVRDVPAIELLEESSSPAKTMPSSDTKALPQAQKRSTTPLQQTTSSTYSSPQSLDLVDYKNPSDSSGVHTRDFAVMPIKSTSSLKKTEPRSLQKSATENAAKAATQSQKKTLNTSSTSRTRQRTPATRKVLSGGFDEEAFARKQADARAALERLQLSLKEDFYALPHPDPSKNRISYGSDTEGRLAAPTSTTSVSKSAARSSSSSQKADREGPPSSYHRLSRESTRVSSMSSTRSRSGGRTPRKSAPPSLKNFEAASAPSNTTSLPLSLLYVLETSTKPPRSPGEISLSSFPLPTSRPTSEHEQVHGSQAGPGVLSHLRRDSSKSQASIASQFSIPFHMIPDRSSSVRETVAEEDEDEGFSS